MIEEINFIDKKLKEYIEKNLLPEYDKNEKAHNIEHIKYVIRRSFELIKQNSLKVNNNIVYVVAAYHDIGHYINPKKHEIISAEMMYKDEKLKKFFSEEERKIIKEAIEDHRASSDHEPRSIYGKIVSSADRNTTIEMVFIRSFFVGKRNMADKSVEEFLEFTLQRLRKRYGTENPENMFFAQ